MQGMFGTKINKKQFQNKMKWKQLFIDGVICCGKTSALFNLEPIKLPICHYEIDNHDFDFHEENIESEMIRLLWDLNKINLFSHIIMDYSFYHKIVCRYCFYILNKQKSILDFKHFIDNEIVKNVLMAYPTLFVILNKSDIKAITDIENIMISKEKNFIFSCKEYIILQNNLFHEIKEANIKNTFFYEKPKNVNIFSTIYYNMIEREIIRTFLNIKSVNSFVFTD